MGGATTKRLIIVGAAIAIPLAAVALYFAIFEPPEPSVPGARGGSGPTGLPPSHPPIAGEATGPPGQGHPQVGGAGRTVRVPDSVRGKWEAVTLRVEQKAGGEPPRVVTAKLGDELRIAGSQLRVRVGEFLPALQVKEGEVTSSSNEPLNPAVLVTASEGGKEIFRGWLFAKFPEVQPFEHPAYRVTLIEGVPKK